MISESGTSISWSLILYLIVSAAHYYALKIHGRAISHTADSRSYNGTHSDELTKCALYCSTRYFSTKRWVVTNMQYPILSTTMLQPRKTLLRGFHGSKTHCSLSIAQFWEITGYGKLCLLLIFQSSELCKIWRETNMNISEDLSSTKVQKR